MTAPEGLERCLTSSFDCKAITKYLELLKTETAWHVAYLCQNCDVT